jgi:hypothetical protein
MPEFPEEVLRKMRAHRLFDHHSDSILADFNCDECENLEARYALSLDFHYARITREIAESARAGGGS